MQQRRRCEGTIPVCTDTWWEEWRRGSQTHGSSVLSDKAVGTLRCKKFHWNVRNAFSTVIELKKQVATEVVEYPWRYSKPDHWSSSLLWVTHLWAVGWTTWSPEVPANLDRPMEKKYCRLKWRRYKTSQILQSVKIFFPAMALSV